MKELLKRPYTGLSSWLLEADEEIKGILDKLDTFDWKFGQFYFSVELHSANFSGSTDLIYDISETFRLSFCFTKNGFIGINLCFIDRHLRYLVGRGIANDKRLDDHDYILKILDTMRLELSAFLKRKS